MKGWNIVKQRTEGITMKSVTRSQKKSWKEIKTITCTTLGIAILSLSLVGCAGLIPSGGTGFDWKSENIRPPQASLSPSMDFNKIASLGIFPLFPSGNSVENGRFAESLINSLTGEVQQRQNQWKTLSYKDVLGMIQVNGLGSGYKNLQADFNSNTGTGGQLVLSPATVQFLDNLQAKSGVDAFLIGTYTLGSHQYQTYDPIFGVQIKQLTKCTVYLTLYYVKDKQNWWKANIIRYGPVDDVVNEIAQSLGANVGKGTLQQL